MKFGVKNKKKKQDEQLLPKNETEKQFVARIQNDLEIAKEKKMPQVEKWKLMNEYYRNNHYTNEQLAALEEEYGAGFVPAVVTEPFTQVESQVETYVPSIQLIGRDDNLDSEKAKQREDVINYILYNTKYEEKLLDNDRELGKYGDCFWVAGWDNTVKTGRYRGDIFLDIASVGEIFPDPSAKKLEDAEYVARVYRMHVRAARRKYGKKFKGVVGDGEHSTTEIFSGIDTFMQGGAIYNSHMDYLDDNTVQIIEYYYKDDEGDIALAVVAGSQLIKHVKKFWGKTRFSGNQMYPIIQVSRIPVLESIWSIGEIEMIIDLVDAADRELAMALLNDAMMANDIVIAPEGAKPDGVEWENRPGAFWETTQGTTNQVNRLGGLSQNSGLVNMMQMLKDEIQGTNGNNDSANGVEPNRVTTASGIAQLNERADKRKAKKSAGKMVGFKKLVLLLDWLALEFYDEERVISVAKEGTQQRAYTTFNSKDMAVKREKEIDRFPDFRRDELIEEEDTEAIPEYYFPQVDVEITAGQGFEPSKPFTFQATAELMQYPINVTNYKVAKGMVELLDLPNKKEIIESFEAAIQMQQQQAQLEAEAKTSQMKAQEAQAAFAQQKAQEGSKQSQGQAPQGGGQQGLTEQDAQALLQMLPPEYQQFLMNLPDEQFLQALTEMSQLPEEEMIDYIIELAS